MCLAGESSRITYALRICMDACRYLGALMVGAVYGASKEGLLAERFSPIPGYLERHSLVPAIDEIARGTFKVRQRPDIKGSGYVVRSLKTALLSFHHPTSFGEGCLMAVNLGDDADTTGAVFGQVAGPSMGRREFPRPCGTDSPTTISSCP